MRVQIEDGDAAGESLVPECSDGDRDVVDGAEPTRTRFPRVMEPARQVQLAPRNLARPAPQTGPRCLQGRAARQAHAGDDLGRPHVAGIH